MELKPKTEPKLTSGLLSQRDRLERIYRDDTQEIFIAVRRSKSASEFLRENEDEDQ